MKIKIAAFCVFVSMSSVSNGQQITQNSPPPVATAAPTVPAVVVISDPSHPNTLRSGTQIPLRFLTEITTENRAAHVGDRIRLEVAENVTADGNTIIPAGTSVTGELTEVRNKGMWGRSGILRGRILSMNLNGRSIRMSGVFDDKGVAGTVGVVAAIALVPVVGFFVTGTSARIEVGSIASSFLEEDISYTLAAAPVPITVVATPPSAPVAPEQIAPIPN